MRHGIAGNKFGRNQKWRQATVRDLCIATLKHGSIKTTRAKAVEARKLVDKLITLGKDNTLAAKRRVFAILCDHSLVSKLFNEIAPRFVTRKGGYTRLIKFAINRQGDNAEMVLLELTELPVVVAAGPQDAQVVEEGKATDLKVTDKKKPSKKPVQKKSEKAPAKKTTTKKTA